MEITRLAEMRPRFVWDIVDDAFDLYRERFALLCGISACVMVPISALTVFYTVSGLSRMASASKSDPFAALGFLGPLFFVTMPLSLAARVAQEAAVSVVVEAELSGQTITIGAAYKRVLRRFWPVVGGLALTAFSVALGSCAAFIGAIFAAIYLAFIAQAIVLENRGAWDAVRRSFQLAQNNVGKVFGLMILIGLVTMLLSYGIQAIVEIIFLLFPTHGANSAQTMQKTIFTQSATSLVGIFLQPLDSVATTLLYYDLRVRREGLDIATAAQETGVSLAPDPFGDAPSETVSRQMMRASRGQR